MFFVGSEDDIDILQKFEGSEDDINIFLSDRERHAAHNFASDNGNLLQQLPASAAAASEVSQQRQHQPSATAIAAAKATETAQQTPAACRSATHGGATLPRAAPCAKALDWTPPTRGGQIPWALRVTRRPEVITSALY